MFSVSSLYFTLLDQKSLKPVVFQKKKPSISSPFLKENITENDECSQKYKRISIDEKE